MPTTILFCRHGQTHWNVSGRLQGQLDTELDATGRMQAAALGVALAARPLDYPLANVVYSSDLTRVSETAAACIGLCYAAGSASPALRLDTRLRERKLGPFEGLTDTESAQTHANEWRCFLRGTEVEGVEGDTEVMARTSSCLRDIAAAHPGHTVLVFSHGGAIHCGVCSLTGAKTLPLIGNCSITQLRVGDDPNERWEAVSVGESPVPASSIRNVDVRL